MDKCGDCQREISDSETPWICDGMIVCMNCWHKLKTPPSPPFLRTRNIVAQVLNAWPKVSEERLGDLDLELLQQSPYGSERKLLFALRVSICVPILVNPEALASRWDFAMWGADRKGGIMFAEQSEDRDTCKKFIEDLYHWKFEGMMRLMTATADQLAAARKSDKAKINVWVKQVEKLSPIPAMFTPRLSGVDKLVKLRLDELRKRITYSVL